MPDIKDYDDDELVQLLGRGELSDRQIAERLGMSASQVGRIARGEIRDDLQPKINAAMRETLREAWKNGGRLATESGEPLPARTAQTAFDRHLAVELIASGQLTLSQIAKRLGIDKSAVWRIMAGRTHPELQELIREAQRHYRERARRLGSYWSAQLMMKQIEVGLKNNGWVGLRARQHLLDRILDEEDDPLRRPASPRLRRSRGFRLRPSFAKASEGYAGQAAGQDGKSDDAPPRPLLPIRSMTELSPPLFAAVLKELGGADLTPEDYENYAAEHKDRAAVLKELGLPERGPEYAEAYAAAHGDGPFIPDCGTDPPGMMLPIRSMAELSLPLRAAVLKELGGPDPEDEDPLFADCNDPPFDAAQGKPFDAPRQARDRQAQGKPFDAPRQARDRQAQDKETWKPVGAEAEQGGATEQRGEVEGSPRDKSTTRAPPDGSR